MAKRAGVSSGAPYRHFPDRDSLLEATGIAYLTGLITAMRTAVDKAGHDPIDRLASTAGAYMRYTIDRSIGIELFATMRGTQYTEFHTRKREMIEFLLFLTQEVDPQATWSEIVEIMEAHLAISQGFSDMYYQGMFSHMKLTDEAITNRAITAAKQLLKGWVLE